MDSLAHFGVDFVPDVICRARGANLWTEDGRRILDWTSGQMAASLGHCHPEIAETTRVASQNLDHLSSLMLSPPIIRLASRLTQILPPGLDKVAFFSTGAESNEAAIRLAKMYTGNFEIVGLAQSWHGGAIPRRAEGTGFVQLEEIVLFRGLTEYICPGMPGQFLLPQPNAYRSKFVDADGRYDWQAELDLGWDLIDQASNGALAACIVECIQGDGGIVPLPDGYLRELKRHCEARNMLLIVDEAQTGLGRSGNWFAIEREGVVPDILTMSKPLANGLPLSATVTSERVDRRAKENGFLFFTTHTNDPLVASVANKVLDIIARDDLVSNARDRGTELLEGLKRLQARCPIIGDVRGRGLLVGIEVVPGWRINNGNKDCATEIWKLLREHGIWCQLQAGRVFRIGPPINSTRLEILEGLHIIEEVFEDVQRRCTIQNRAVCVREGPRL